jgi:pyrroloquinoline-quinone synthase
MTIKSQLDERIAPWALLKHPFYQAWEAGELPIDALRTYAREYGAFIATLPAGWQALNDEATAEEEGQHIALWRQFADGLGTELGEAELAGVSSLVETAGELFSRAEDAVGALYAFEAQQPDTAKSKLAGLREHYKLPERVEPYFKEHSHNEHEAEKLLRRIAALGAVEQAAALAACSQMSEALWNALTDIYETHCEM